MKSYSIFFYNDILFLQCNSVSDVNILFLTVCQDYWTTMPYFFTVYTLILYFFFFQCAVLLSTSAVMSSSRLCAPERTEEQTLT